MAVLCAALCLSPMTKSSIKRWMEAMGSNVPTPEAMLRQLLALAPATEGPMDGDDPWGTENGVRVVKEAPDRILITHEAVSEHGEEAKQCLQRGKALGLQVTAAFSDDSQSFTEAIKAVDPQARFQADHCHTVKHSWGPLTKSRLSSRRKGKASGEAPQHEASMALAKKLWTWRWSLRKKPSNVSVEAKQAMTALASEEEGCVHRFRSILRQLVHIFDQAHSEAHATRRRQQLRKDIQTMADPPLEKIPQCFDAHWEQALRYLRQKGMGTHRRGSHSESGMRLLRRLEKNHDGIRSAATRQHYSQIYQAIKYLSLDIAEFIEQGPHMAVLPGV